MPGSYIYKQTMTTLTARFRAILAILRTAVAPLAVFEHPRTAIFILLVKRISRMANRFDALFAKWQAGTLPKPRPSRAGQTRKPCQRLRLPGRRAWLLHVTEHVRLAAAVCGGQLQHQFADPDFEKFLQAAPQAGRILRPLCHMLGIDAPQALRPSVNAASPAKADVRAPEWTREGGEPARDVQAHPTPALSGPLQSPSPPPRFSPA